MAIVGAAMATVAVMQPPLATRALVNGVVVVALGGTVLLVNRAGHSARAAALLLAGLMTVILLNALGTGGIRSPGVQSLFIIAVLAGVLLDFRSSVIVAIVIALATFGLVALEYAGRLPAPTAPYASTTLWALAMLYVGLAVLVMRLATTSLTGALHRAQAALATARTADRRLQMALDAGRVGTYDFDLQTYDFLPNVGTVRLTGLSPGPDGLISGEAWKQRVHVDDWPQVEAELQRFALGEPHSSTRYRYHHPDGQLREFEVSAFLDRGTADDASARIVGVLVDVTERERESRERALLAEQLRERVKELRALHEASQLLQYARTVDAEVLSELVRRIPAAFLHAHAAEARIVYGDTVVATPGWRDATWRLSMPFRSNDAVGRIEVSYRDGSVPADHDPFLVEERQLIASLAEMLRARIEERSTEQRRAQTEAQLRHAQRLDALGRLAGGIAHDFNNILTAIAGNAELAAQQLGPDATVADEIREIVTASARAKDLVRRILLFSRQSGSHRAVLDVRPLVREVAELLSVSLPSGVTLQVDDGGDRQTVLADGSQLHQVLVNLGTNAVYAMRDRGGVLQLAIRRVRREADDLGVPPGDYVQLTVRDNGVGMSEQVLEHLFEPFFTTKGDAGTGLGLAVAHGIVRDHGGAISVESTVGVGTTFTLVIPAVADEPVTVAAEAVIQRGHGERLLLVDDEPALVAVLGRSLRWMGYHCTEFTSATAALQAFRATPHDFAALVTDCSMPELDGLDLVRALRAIRPELPVAVVSGFAAREGYAGDLEPIVWIEKPSTMVELSRAIRATLDGA